jgi:predicted alpha-1,2-mannosidase
MKMKFERRCEMPSAFFHRDRWMRYTLIALSLCATLSGTLVRAATDTAKSPGDLTHEVYPFLGVDWGGNTFVGSAVPFGMVKLGPDMENFDGRRSNFGYMSGGRILGFSHLHLSGAAGKYGNILVMPTTGALDINDVSSPRSSEENQVGYYAAQLSRYSIKAELTSTRRVGVHRYTFPASKDAHILIDVAHCLSRGPGSESQRFLGGEIHFVSDREARGVGRYAGGWNKGGEYRVYFDILLDTPAKAEQTWTGSSHAVAKDAAVDTDTPIGGSFDFATAAGKVVQAKVGISFISSEQARQNIEQEVPRWDFNAVHSAATVLWNKQLSAITLNGATDSQRKKIYTAIYHTMLMPADRTGENPGWQSSEPYYDDYYAIWDTFRSSGPLLTLIAPDRQRDMIRSLIDIYKHTGYMPDARSGNDNGRTQGGSNANVVIADAWEKKLTGIDYETAFQAMVHDAEVPPADAQKEGRGGLRDYNTRGYITLADERAGSRTVEYSYDDFAIAEVACGLNKPKEAALYASRAHNFENLWDKDMSVEGINGFLRPRNAGGSWAAPYLTVRGTWPDFMYEGDIWTYSLYAPQDMRRIIELSGGNQAFVDRLDHLFLRRHFDITNEPGFLVPVMYNWAGRPDKTADVVNQYLEKAFTDNRAGIPGNDDSGAMSSWLIFQTLGFYPNAGQEIYLISTPSIPDASIHLANGKTFHIIARNLDHEGLNRYVQSATLNGLELKTSWFRHSQITDGGTLILTMGSAPSKWGTTAPPPSMSDNISPLCAAASTGMP